MAQLVVGDADAGGAEAELEHVTNAIDPVSVDGDVGDSDDVSFEEERGGRAARAGMSAYVRSMKFPRNVRPSTSQTWMPS